MKFYTLDERCALTKEYCKGKHFSDEKIQAFFADAFYRYIVQYRYISKETTLECLKKFYQDNVCKEKFDELIKTYGLNFLNENNRLLMQKSIYLQQYYPK